MFNCRALFKQSSLLILSFTNQAGIFASTCSLFFRQTVWNLSTRWLLKLRKCKEKNGGNLLNYEIDLPELPFESVCKTMGPMLGQNSPSKFFSPRTQYITALRNKHLSPLYVSVITCMLKHRLFYLARWPLHLSACLFSQLPTCRYYSTSANVSESIRWGCSQSVVSSVFEADSACNHSPVFTELLTVSFGICLLVLAHSGRQNHCSCLMDTFSWPGLGHFSFCFQGRSAQCSVWSISRYAHS